jgi:tRNA pseudouridine55 synthase
LKQDGKPLYEYARAGITRERAPRAITIHAMRVLEWRSPDLRFEVSCSKGAYIRVLVEDFAAQLGTIGHMAALHRVSVVPFAAERQWNFEELEAMSPAQREMLLLPVDAALSACRRFDLPAEGVSALRQGRTVGIALENPGMVRIYAVGLGFLGLGEVQSAGLLKPLRLISSVANRA